MTLRIGNLPQSAPRASDQLPPLRRPADTSDLEAAGAAANPFLLKAGANSAEVLTRPTDTPSQAALRQRQMSTNRHMDQTATGLQGGQALSLSTGPAQEAQSLLGAARVAHLEAANSQPADITGAAMDFASRYRLQLDPRLAQAVAAVHDRQYSGASLLRG